MLNIEKTYSIPKKVHLKMQEELHIDVKCFIRRGAVLTGLHNQVPVHKNLDELCTFTCRTLS